MVDVGDDGEIADFGLIKHIVTSIDGFTAGSPGGVWPARRCCGTPGRRSGPGRDSRWSASRRRWAGKPPGDRRPASGDSAPWWRSCRRSPDPRQKGRCPGRNTPRWPRRGGRAGAASGTGRR